MSADEELNASAAGHNKLVRPKVEFQTLLQLAGATKDVFTMTEVMFYLGEYIFQKQLYDQKQQHIVRCSHDALGQVLGVDSFSIKEPGLLFAMVTKNLVSVKSQESQQSSSESQTHSPADRGTEEVDSESLRSSDPDSSEDDSEETHSSSVRSEIVVAPSDSDSDAFSVEFEVESVDSDDYSEDEASLSSDEQVYKFTIFEEEEESFDEDTEINKADYWQCTQCKDLNPPLPRHCLRCWPLQQDWLLKDSSESACSSPKAAAPTPPQSVAREAPGSGAEDNEGVSSSSSSFSSFSSCSSCLDPCLICQSQPRNGCIMHGQTGHLMSCFQCARKLKKRNKLCPACRLPIQAVILTYFS